MELLSHSVISSFSPPEQINLRLILVSGKTKDFLFDPNDSAADIAQYVFDHWPQGKRICPSFHVSPHLCVMRVTECATA